MSEEIKVTEETTVVEETTAVEEVKSTHRKSRTGIVTSNKMEKTITISVERRIQHPIYGKYMKKTKKFMAHDEEQQCNEGDVVRIEETRPLSKKKRWTLVEIIERAK